MENIFVPMFFFLRNLKKMMCIENICFQGALLKTNPLSQFYRKNKTDDSKAFSTTQSIKPYYCFFNLCKTKLVEFIIIFFSLGNFFS